MSKKYLLNEKAEIYVHNDLNETVKSLQERLEEKYSNDDITGIYYEELACMAFIAFTTEARINVIGYKTLGEGWPEMAGYEDKLNLLIKVIPLRINENSEIYKSVKKLFKIRNLIAHAKPEIIDREKEITDPDPDLFEMLRSRCNRLINRNNRKKIHSDMEKLWKIMKEENKLDDLDFLTQGSHSIKAVKK